MFKAYEMMETAVKHNAQGGEGSPKFRYLFSAEELGNRAELMAVITLEPGESVGVHPHTSNGEAYFILEGGATMTEDGETRILGPEYENLDLTRYSSSVFGMFRGAPARVHLRFENALAGVVIDRFGRGVMLVPDGDAHFTLMADIAVSPQFFAWLAGFGPRVKILHPTQIAEDYVNYIKSALEPYA